MCENPTNCEAVLINGVVLTTECIKRLKQFQEHDNEEVREIRDHIADAVCFVAESLDSITIEEDMEKAKHLLTNLSYVRDYINDFKKP